MYTMANTTVSILRGVGSDYAGDDEDLPVPIQTGIPAFISSPGFSPYQPKILGTAVFDPSDEVTAQVRGIICALPSGTDVTPLDQILDEGSQVTYRVVNVTQQGRLGGIIPDLLVQLERVTTTQSV